MRLVNEVHAGLQVVPEATHPGRVPGEVVAELELVLLRLLRRVHVVADRQPVRKRLLRIARPREDRIREIRVLEDELVQTSAAKHHVVVEIDRVELVVAVAPVGLDAAVFGVVDLRVRVPPVAHRRKLILRQVRRNLSGEQVLAAGRREHAFQAWVQSESRHGLFRVLLCSLDGGEEVRLVLHDWSAERPAVLIAAVVLLVDVAQLFGFGLRIQGVVAVRREPAAAEIIGAALGDDVHHPAVAAAVLGLVALGNEVELLDRLQRV